ncbi:MAG: alcohol dehydrogenase catalytic domain-containing protein [Granulosicoccus sp.]|nr:alcohol dehydrogenase catalytic domain-containing protein [Granulosicoccus sp.]
MKALVYTAPETLEYDTVPHPGDAADLQAGDVLIRIDSVGICGSDMHAYLGHDSRRPAPIILGHEAAGVVIGGDEDGRRVTVNPLVTCGRCRWCTGGRQNLCAHRQIISMPPRAGAFAEWLTMPLENLSTIPEHISFAQASLAEPIACGWHAVQLASDTLWKTLSEVRALVIGGGPIGVGAALSLRCHGTGKVLLVEPSELRRDYLASQGELDVRSPDAPEAQQGFDLVIDCVGYAATRAQASRVVEPGGLIMHIGLAEAEGGLDTRRMTLQEIGFIGTYTYTPKEFRDVVSAIADGRLGKLEWIEQRSLADGAQAFADIRAGRVAAPKIILNP